ncbi:MAG: hypothetical protein GX591_00420 [Planctomycetes bacterium]|nr:hypothetical protein [Planctomycetota bacterium]
MQSRRHWLTFATAALALLATIPAATAADAWIARTPDGAAGLKAPAAAQPPLVSLADQRSDRLTVTVDLAGLEMAHRKTPAGAFVELALPGESLAGDIGAPQLPVIRRLLIAPPDADVQVDLSIAAPLAIDSQTVGAPLLVMPVQPPIEKLPGARAQAEFLYDAAAYARAAAPAVGARVEDVGIYRGRRLVLLEISPLAYDAAAQQATLWTQLAATVTFAGPPAAPATIPARGLDRIVLNPDDLVSAAGFGNFVIITAPAYATAVADYATAKQGQGFTVTTYTAPAGSTNAAIKTYIAGLYADPLTRPDYILLVGDTDTIPHWTGGGEGSPPTDLPYVCMDGSTDWLPDIAIGRFPVRTPEQLQAMIDKTLYVMAGAFADPDYLNRAVFMASEDNYTVSEGTHNWVIATYLEPAVFAYDKLYCHTYNATTQQVRTAFNAGRVYGIYSGHGAETYWADGPQFTQADVNGLTNANMYSFVWSFACVTGNYTIAECFTETWARAAGKGAVTIYGSSVNSYWTEDDVLEKRLFDVLYEDYIREVGPAWNQTLLYYLQEMGNTARTRRYFEMYNLMGDPSVAIPGGQAALRVTPTGDLRTQGPEGGPFNPTSTIYTLRNYADYPIDYAVTADPAATWVALTGPTTGTLPPDGVAQVTVALTPEADALAIGLYEAAIEFVNLTDHVGDAVRHAVLEVGRYLFTSTDVPKPIADNATITSTLTVTDNFCIADVNVPVNISHTYIGDLRITLTSPQGTVVTLHNRGGGTTDNIVGTFDDEGSLIPAGPVTLADLVGESPAGTWTLTISDMAGGDTGTLNAWALEVLPSGTVCPPVAFGAGYTLPVNTPLDVTLSGISQGSEPLDFVITALPTGGTLRDPATGPIAAVPHVLSGHGQVVRYLPAYGYQGTDEFTFVVTDETGTSAPAAITFVVGGPQPVHVFPLDANPGWTTTGQWAFGTPSGSGNPTGGYTGTYVYGYNLSGNYPSSMSQIMYLTTGALDLTGVTGTELRFRRWLGIESSSYDHANIQVSRDGANWTTVWEHAGATFAETAWSLQTYDIATVADNQPTVYIRWGMGPTDGSVTYVGWNIDDVEIWGLVPSGGLVGDVNCDGAIDTADIDPFVMALVNPDGYAATYPDCDLQLADCNGDGVVDTADIDAFVALIVGG